MYDYMTIKDLKNIIDNLPDDMLVVIPVVDECNVNSILGFRKVRTAGILVCETESDPEVLCLNGAMDDQDISDQVYFSGINISVKDVLYGKCECVMED